MEPVRLIVYSDYLCPWCYNAAVRLRRLEEELGDRVAIEWRSFLLRPRPDPRRTLEKFRAYTESWRRPAAEADSGSFRVWATDAGPPSHSVPPHLVAKAAASISGDAFRRMHERLLEAYFAENQDITDSETLLGLWCEVGLRRENFARAGDPAVLRQVLEQHNEAIEIGVTGVPAVRADGNPAAITGAHPIDFYRRWIHKLESAEGL